MGRRVGLQQVLCSPGVPQGALPESEEMQSSCPSAHSFRVQSWDPIHPPHKSCGVLGQPAGEQFACAQCLDHHRGPLPERQHMPWGPRSASPGTLAPGLALGRQHPEKNPSTEVIESVPPGLR